LRLLIRVESRLHFPWFRFWRSRKLIQRPSRQYGLVMTEIQALSTSLRSLDLELLFGEQDTSETSVEATYSVSAPVVAVRLSAASVPAAVHISSAVSVMPSLTQGTESSLVQKFEFLKRKIRRFAVGDIANLTGFSATPRVACVRPRKWGATKLPIPSLPSTKVQGSLEDEAVRRAAHRPPYNNTPTDSSRETKSTDPESAGKCAEATPARIDDRPVRGL
jgi:hypothetical protein